MGYSNIDIIKTNIGLVLHILVRSTILFIEFKDLHGDVAFQRGVLSIIDCKTSNFLVLSIIHVKSNLNHNKN